MYLNQLRKSTILEHFERHYVIVDPAIDLLKPQPFTQVKERKDADETTS